MAIIKKCLHKLLLGNATLKRVYYESTSNNAASNCCLESTSLNIVTKTQAVSLLDTLEIKEGIQSASINKGVISLLSKHWSAAVSSRRAK